MQGNSNIKNTRHYRTVRAAIMCIGYEVLADILVSVQRQVGE